MLPNSIQNLADPASRQIDVVGEQTLQHRQSEYTGTAGRRNGSTNSGSVAVNSTQGGVLSPVVAQAKRKQRQRGQRADMMNWEVEYLTKEHLTGFDNYKVCFGNAVGGIWERSGGH